MKSITDYVPSHNKAFVMYSGGLGSFINAWICKQVYEETILYFKDTKTEDSDLYRFLRETVEALKLPLIEDSDGRDVWQVFEDNRFIGNSRVDVCSRVLKRERGKKYLKKHKLHNSHDIIFGFDWTEIHRLDRAKAREEWATYHLASPLADLLWDKNEVANKILKELGIKRPRLYDMEFSHNNCGGFCVKQGHGGFIKLLNTLPDVYESHERKEKELLAKNPNLKPFIRKQVNGVKVYLTMEEFRKENMNNKGIQLDLDLYDYGGCGCGI